MRVDFRRELRNRARFHEGSPNRVAHEIVNHCLLPETNFGLRRMDVDVNFRAGHLQKQQHDGKDACREDVAVSLSQSVLDDAIANKSPIHKNKD